MDNYQWGLIHKKTGKLCDRLFDIRADAMFWLRNVGTSFEGAEYRIARLSIREVKRVKK